MQEYKYPSLSYPDTLSRTEVKVISCLGVCVRTYTITKARKLCSTRLIYHCRSGHIAFRPIVLAILMKKGEQIE